jgi:Putative ABC exporter
VIRTSLFIISRTAWNRARVRVRRLRQPRYLLGAVAAVAYLYLSLVRGPGPNPRFSRPDRVPPAERVRITDRSEGLTAREATDAVVGVGSLLAAMTLAAGAALIWVLPIESGLLEFSKAEVQYLFPAPIRRRQLLVHRLLRSQIGLLFASLIPAVLLPRGAAGSARLRVALAMWVVLVSLRLYLTGVTLARPRLRHPEWRARVTAWAPLLLLAGPSLSAFVIFGRAMRSTGLPGVAARLDAARVGATDWLLGPFSALVAPLFSGDWYAFAPAIAGSILIMFALVAWVLVSDGVFEAAAEMTVDRKERQVVTSGARYRATRGFALAASGRSDVAIFWKAATHAVRAVNLRVLARLVLPVTVLVIAASRVRGVPSGISETLAGLTLASLFFLTVMGPQIVRMDLRQELEHLPLIKTWPIPAATIIRGQLLWPVSLLTVIVWSLLLVAAFLSPAAFPDLTLGWRFALMCAGAIVAPGLLAAQYVIHNAAAIFFPAWVTIGRNRSRGLDAMGQRLIMLFGTWLTLGLLALPGAVAATVIWFVLSSAIGPLALLPGALVWSAALLAETVIATSALAPMFDRLDLTDIERAE